MGPNGAVARPKAGAVTGAMLVVALVLGLGVSVLAGRSDAAETTAYEVVAGQRTLQPVRDTFVRRSLPFRSFGAHRTLSLGAPRAGLGLLAFRPSVPVGATVTGGRLCVTPVRGAAARVAVLTASRRWSASTTWRSRPALFRYVGVSAARAVAGRRTCVRVPASTLTSGLTAGEVAFAARSSRRGVTVPVAASETRYAPTLTVAFKQRRPAPTPTPTPTPAPTTPAPSTAVAPVPNGPTGAWRLTFADEFDGTAVDWAKWSDRSSAEADGGHGNLTNQQLEWNQGKNCSVADGLLTITAKPDDIRSASGQHYDWSSCLLSSSPSYAFRYGYMETRAKFPSQRGFWPAFWTWQADGNNTWTETDAYEYYSDNPKRLYVTQHSGQGGGCSLSTLGFDPSQGFHTYGVDITPTGTAFYVDGRKVCSAAGTSTGMTNIIVDMFVYSQIPPAPGTVGRKQVDYVRAWQR
ncbi:MAG: glycoside hydrolase family 16 protein [Nocardioidaceae bacterium]|nr:glycoside hydrolase family 16 protein [Nocardioidaceae bacterium]